MSSPDALFDEKDRAAEVSRLIRLATCALAFVLLSCRDKTPPPPQGATPSPNASILPAPLASAGDLVRKQPLPAGSVTAGIPADSAGHLIVREAEEPPPVHAQVNEALPRDRVTSRDGIGLTLDAQWVWADMPPRPAIFELSADAIKEAAEKTTLNVTVDLSYSGRMRFALESAAFPLPAHTELRARSDYYGHVLVWPSGNTYRILAPGSLRAVFAERRADVTPVMRAKVKRLGEGQVLGLKTSQVQLATTLGTLLLDQSEMPGSGRAGQLLCRLLIDLVAVDPQTDACAPEHVPLAARYEWVDGGSLVFRVDAIVNRLDLPLGSISVPPSGAEFVTGELPPQSAGVFLTREQLVRFRTREVAPKEAPPKGAPGEGILAVNHTDTLRYLLLDGVAVAWVRPRQEQYLIGPKPGRYSIAWRDFFGTSIQAPALVDVPARVELGVPAGDGGRAP